MLQQHQSYVDWWFSLVFVLLQHIFKGVILGQDLWLRQPETLWLRWSWLRKHRTVWHWLWLRTRLSWARLGQRCRAETSGPSTDSGGGKAGPSSGPDYGGVDCNSSGRWASEPFLLTTQAHLRYRNRWKDCLNLSLPHPRNRNSCKDKLRYGPRRSITAHIQHSQKKGLGK